MHLYRGGGGTAENCTPMEKKDTGKTVKETPPPNPTLFPPTQRIASKIATHQGEEENLGEEDSPGGSCTGRSPVPRRRRADTSDFEEKKCSGMKGKTDKNHFSLFISKKCQSIFVSKDVKANVIFDGYQLLVVFELTVGNQHSAIGEENSRNYSPFATRIVGN